MSGTRPPVASDKYYSADPQLLTEQVEACLTQPAPGVATPAAAHTGRMLRGLIVPHGAMQDSGFVAAAAYQLLATALAASPPPRHHRSTGGAASSPAPPLRIVILGTNHFAAWPSACLSAAAAWATPLGDVTVDRELVAELVAAGLPVDDASHNREHSIENQLPFLQRLSATSGRAFTITPLCIASLGSLAAADHLAATLAGLLRRHPPGSVLLMATSDFTHAGPAYGEPPDAAWMSLREHCLWRDGPVLHAACTPPATGRWERTKCDSNLSQQQAAPLGEGSPAGSPRSSAGGLAAGFLQACASTQSSLCGMWPMATFLCVAERLGWATQLLAYAPSDLYTRSSNINGFAAFAAWGR